MNCMNCGALLTDREYCPHCGCDILVQRKAYYLSDLYYNQGLEKASIRDLSGAIQCLRRSLTFNKNHMQARNLLGLVYFEMGEVVSALSEWVISKNLNPVHNLAGEYIEKVQSNPNKLSTISESIRKYNHALAYCREGHEDMAMIQLKKVLSQNPKLIKGYHLLALLQIREKNYSKARRTLKKAAKIDKTNTTTLRFLREVDEQTGVATNLDKRDRTEEEERRGRRSVFRFGSNPVIQTPSFREGSLATGALTFFFGLALGAAAIWFLAVPAKTQQIHQNANAQIQEHMDAVTSKDAELDTLRAQVAAAEKAAKEEETQVQSAQELLNSYEGLLNAMSALEKQEETARAMAVSYLATVNREILAESGKAAYDVVKNGQNITDDELASAAPPVSAAPQEETGAEGEDGSYDDGGYDDSGYDDGGYDDSGYDDGGYDDSGYDDGSYDDSGYDENGYYDEEGNDIEY